MTTSIKQEPQQQNRFIIVDVQGIFIGDKFHAKEVCVSISDFEIRTFLISTLEKHSELTNKDIKVNNWLFNNFHGIHWNKGYSALQDVIDYLKTTLKKREQLYSVIYVKGNEKIKWLIDLLKGEIEICVVNLNELNCPNIRTLYKSNTNLNTCENHYNCDRICAGKNTILFRNFVKLILNKENSIPNI